MKLPVAPPDLQDIVTKVFSDNTQAAFYILTMAKGLQPTVDGKYRHWDILRHLTPPEGMNPKVWWATIKTARGALAKRFPYNDRSGKPFSFAVVDPMFEMLHRIDQEAGGAIQAPMEITDSQTRDTYLIKSLVEEAITSSQLEGASTTRDVAKAMLQEGRAPRDRSEQMIYNNYQAMLFIGSVRGAPLSPAIVFELHRRLTCNTLDDASAAGRFRTSAEDIAVVDYDGTTLHTPPVATELEARLNALCAFANAADESGPFIHPVVRSVLLHFMLAYDHPFVDGNGRTARALFYWSMAKRGYWLVEFLSISRILKKAPGKYTRAFLYTETDDNDATYFILNQLRVIVRAIDDLHVYLRKRAKELDETRRALEQSRWLDQTLNQRQLALVRHALRKPEHVYTIASHQRAHGISYQTARTDLLQLARLQLVDRGKRGKEFIFIAPAKLGERIGGQRR